MICERQVGSFDGGDAALQHRPAPGGSDHATSKKEMNLKLIRFDHPKHELQRTGRDFFKPPNRPAERY
jgi:hypothetical protein